MPVSTRSSSRATRSSDRKKSSSATIATRYTLRSSLSRAKRRRGLKGLEARPTKEKGTKASRAVIRARATSTIRSKRERQEPAVSETSSPVKRSRKRPIGALHERQSGLSERETAICERENAVRERENATKERELAFQELEIVKKQLERKIQKMATSRAQSEQVARDLKLKLKTVTDERDMLAEMEAARGPALPGPDLRWVLSHLEEHSQCSLCFEIMANPYALNNGNCGHVFCALCILKWAFALLHRGCGYWHDALECPLCHATLPYTERYMPRDICTFPFVPDRFADTVIKSHLAVLQDAADSPARQTTSYNGGSHHSFLWHGEVDQQVLAWGQGKASRIEWEQREHTGKTEMTLLFHNWIYFTPEDFVAMKDRLRAA